MADYTGAIFRGGYEGFIAIADETAELKPHQRTLAAAPAVNAWKMVGYSDLPNITVSDAPQGVQSVGSHRDLAQYKGPRTCSYRANIIMSAYAPAYWGAGKHLLHYALRSGQAGTVYRKGLPLVTIAAGAVDGYEDGAGYTDIGRQALVNTASLTWSEGQAVRCSLDIKPLAVQKGTSGQVIETVDAITGGLNLDDTAFGNVLTWHDFDWQIAGQSYRDIVKSASFSLSNQVQPDGVRQIYRSAGESAELSRCPYSLKPGHEQLSLNVSLADRLPSSLFSANDTGIITLRAEGYDPSNTLRLFQIQILHGMIAQDEMQGGGATNPFAFSTPIYTRWVNISYT